MTSIWCSSRLVVSVMCCLGLVTLYSLRVNMSVAIVCMVNHTAVEMSEYTNASDTENKTTTDICKKHIAVANESEDVLHDGPFNWSKEEQGFILSGYFWGYIVTQIPGGLLASKFGGKQVLAWFMFAGVVANLFMPVAASYGFSYLIALRIIIGIGQGAGFPAVQTVLAHWTPPLEVSLLCGFALAGSQVGNVITFPIAGLLCEYGFAGGWPSIFYVLGGLGGLWFLAWMILIHDSPDTHPRISEKEKKYINSSLSGKISTGERKSIPWLSIFTSKAVWAIILTHALSNWGTDVFLTMIPTYMRDVLKFEIKKNGGLSALPYIGLWVCMILSSSLADFIRKREFLSPTATRKIFNTVGQVVPAMLMIGTGFMDCDNSTMAVVLLTLGVTATGLQNGGGFLVNFADIAPQYAGIIFGISNTLATIPGIIAPTVVDAITPHGTQEEWQVVFYITAGIYVCASIVYIILGSGEIQEWAKTKNSSIEMYVVPISDDSENTKL